jgi:hypothetical protein
MLQVHPPGVITGWMNRSILSVRLC